MDEKSALEFLEEYDNMETEDDNDPIETHSINKTWAQITEQEDEQDQKASEQDQKASDEDQGEEEAKTPNSKTNRRIPCAFEFSNFGCRVQNGKCKYSHDIKDMAEYSGVLPTVRKCQNAYCKNACMGKNCSSCVRFKLQQLRTGSSFQDRKVRLCPVPGCSNTCKGRVCRGCHFRFYANR